MNPNFAMEVHSICDALVPQYDAFEDLPWAVLYEYLDAKYKNSKFILTTRPSDRWIKSVSGHFRDTYIPMHEWVYGVGYPQGNEQKYLETYNTHNREVLNYFKDRPQDLLHLPLDGSLSSMELWQSLCNFLEKPIPNEKFPFSNKKSDRLLWNRLRRIKHRVYGKKPIQILGVKFGRNFSSEDV